MIDFPRLHQSVNQLCINQKVEENNVFFPSLGHLVVHLGECSEFEVDVDYGDGPPGTGNRDVVPMETQPDATSCRAHCKDKWQTPYFTWHGGESFWSLEERNGFNLFPQFATVPCWRSILHIPLELDIIL